MGINTLYNEDAPYVADNGTLFFSSNGLPGYGGFDIYKTHLEDGKWSAPENLGQPINSPGDEMYFALTPNSPDGYYASSRVGGMGDMDIYQVHYVLSKVRECSSQSQDIMAINATPGEGNKLAYQVNLQMPEGYEKKVRSYTWSINNQPVMQTASGFNHTFDAPGSYTIASKTIVYCDTCTSLISFCSEKVVDVGQKVTAINYNSEEMKKGKTTVASEMEKDKIVFVKAPEKNKSVAKDEKDETAENGKRIKETVATDVTKAESSKGTSFLSEDELLVMNWNRQPAYFAYNEAELDENAKRVLDDNISVMKINQTLSIVINGFADSRGSEYYNKNLSLKRAQAVKQYMIEKGVNGKRILATYGIGESELVNNCDNTVECSEDQHQANRRVEFQVTNRVVKGGVITLK
jgi:outer membrane protein OmpA-like peptidoglycan-associated protein